ncbi:MAG: DUF1573 domain-containing protein [Bacteroidota bacterium]
MEKSKQIQIGLLGVIALLVVLGLTGVFDGIMGGSGSEDAKDAARQTLVTGDKAVTPGETANPANPAAPAEPAIPAGPTTTVEFEESEFDFGVVDAGEKVTHVYKFTNTGDEPLIISNAKGSCGCTVPNWPKEPIAPGNTGEIKVQFDSKNKKGKQSKRVTITANTDPVQTFLTIKGEVTPDPNAAQPAAPVPAQKK